MVVDDYSEFLGYAASFVVLVSMALPSARWLRIVNLVGAVLFMAYGLLIEAWPIVVFNTLIAVLDIYYLVKLRGDTSPSDPQDDGDKSAEHSLTPSTI